MPRVFISYRREDSSAYAGRLFDRLEDRFGKSNVFMDIDSLAPGVDFIEVINSNVGACDFLLAIIGKNWLAAKDDQGRRRLDDPEDFVRLEISAALTRGVRVIPLLVGGAQMPRSQELPKDLAGLARRQAITFYDDAFRARIDSLIRNIEETAEAARKAEEERQTREAAEVARKADEERQQQEAAEADRKAEQERIERDQATAARKAEQEPGDSNGTSITQSELQPAADLVDLPVSAKRQRDIRVQGQPDLWIRRWLLLYKPVRWWAWIPRLFFYYVAFGGVVALFVLILQSFTDHADRAVDLETALPTFVCFEVLALPFRVLSRIIEGPRPFAFSDLVFAKSRRQ